MTSHEMTLTFDQFSSISRGAAADRAFRLVLLPGEVLRVPRRHSSLRVLSGAAWVSHRGLDHALYAGDTLPLEPARHEAVVSAEGEPLFLEIA
ncbi:MAG TPA: DUF2917 domain-containing protein [Holophaga sp.]|nr:DUF2917 domain-containing protein [Holophaga sp.]